MNLRNAIDWLFARKAVEQAGEDLKLRIAEFMAQRARQYCPVDTGVLVRSIDIIAPKASDTYHVVATAFYAQWVIFGHMTSAGTWVPPNPFMQLAMADAAREFPQIASTIRLRRPEYYGNESEGLVGSDVQHVGVSF